MCTHDSTGPSSRPTSSASSKQRPTGLVSSGEETDYKQLQFVEVMLEQEIVEPEDQQISQHRQAALSRGNISNAKKKKMADYSHSDARKPQSNHSSSRAMPRRNSIGDPKSRRKQVVSTRSSRKKSTNSSFSSEHDSADTNRSSFDMPRSGSFDALRTSDGRSEAMRISFDDSRSSIDNPRSREFQGKRNRSGRRSKTTGSARWVKAKGSNSRPRSSIDGQTPPRTSLDACDNGYWDTRRAKTYVNDDEDDDGWNEHVKKKAKQPATESDDDGYNLGDMIGDTPPRRASFESDADNGYWEEMQKNKINRVRESESTLSSEEDRRSYDKDSSDSDSYAKMSKHKERSRQTSSEEEAARSERLFIAYSLLRNLPESDEDKEADSYDDSDDYGEGSDSSYEAAYQKVEQQKIYHRKEKLYRSSTSESEENSEDLEERDGRFQKSKVANFMDKFGYRNNAKYVLYLLSI